MFYDNLGIHSHYAYNYITKNIQIILKMQNEKVPKKIKCSYLVIAIFFQEAFELQRDQNAR